VRPVLALATGLVAIVCGLTIFAALLVVFIGDQRDYTACKADQAVASAASAERGDRTTVIARVAGRIDDRWLIDVERTEEGGVADRQWTEGSCGLDLSPWRHYRIVLAPGEEEPAVVSYETLGRSWPAGLKAFSALSSTERYAWCALIPFIVAVTLMASTLRRHPA
jgi:hypothetical protein